ncbi:MAG TPA: YceI family protein [Bacteroidales bacterium]
MFFRKGVLILILWVFSTYAYTQTIYMTRTGSVSFVSNAPLEIIKASSSSLAGAINLADNKFAFIIPNQSLKGFNSELQQEHFYENYMEVEKYANSTFEGKIIEKIDGNSDEVQQLRAKGKLNIHGVEQERIIEASIQFKGEKIIVLSDFNVELKDHNIHIPRIVNQKIAETIEVKIKAELELKKD